MRKGGEAMDTSTLLVVFLLVMAASLASYALSHWSSIRSAIGVGWAATSIGTTMLLTAAAIVVLTFVFRGPLWRPNLGAEQQSREAGAASKETSHRISASPVAVTNAATAEQTSESVANRQSSGRSPAAVGANQQTQPPAATRTTQSNNDDRNSQPGSAFKDADPWAATRCVYVFNPDLSDPTRWKIENGCDAPVGIVVDPDRSIILPAPAQRPITLDEQTLRVSRANYRACFVATSQAITLISAPSEERSTPEWHQQFVSARANDGCLVRLPSSNN
jgi:hypothetical protein